MNTRAVVKVGDGRGFIVAAAREWVPGEFIPNRFIITAAHCLPSLPPIWPDTADRTYPDLVGRLGDNVRAWAECVFVDPIADVAVLCEPDGQYFLDGQWDLYQSLIEDDEEITPLVIAEAPAEGAISLLSLDGRWFGCSMKRHQPNGSLWIFDAAEGIVGGMSGSPILAANGMAIGVISESGGSTEGDNDRNGPAPALTRNLPGWLLRELAAPR